MMQKTNIQQRIDQTVGWFLEEMDAGTSIGYNSARTGEMKKLSTQNKEEGTLQTLQRPARHPVLWKENYIS